MREIIFDLGRTSFPIRVPDYADIHRMSEVTLLSHPEEKLRHALKNPIESLPLPQLVKKRLSTKPDAKATIVISDNTRPVPYSGTEGILFPLLDEMIFAGLPPDQITLLVATGTHHPMSEKELMDFIDPRVFSLGTRIVNHDCKRQRDLIRVGKTEIGGDIYLNRCYLESDIKILTGLVESHFMAGTSGGRKSICPGLLGDESTAILHGAKILASPQAADLTMAGNPVHDEALRVAKMVGCDMIVNVTLDSDYRLTGIFVGDMEGAHEAAVEKLISYAAIPVNKKYDLVVTHAGFVGINHYQAAKGAVIAASMIKPNGICVLAASHPDADPIGGSNYQAMLKLLGESGQERYLDMILSPDWKFVPEQWEAQMWTRLFRLTPVENLIYCTLDISETDFRWLPGTDARILGGTPTSLAHLTENAITHSVEKLQRILGRDPDIAILPDGPYGIPLTQG